ncbi:C40 family peptidase [Metabacillus arenae]|uniref:Permuted papain-like amidase YaeF/Yiix C92 family enzyme n=1 Tax=Metabacillus arenae TaxID=2771434 RepID=A0A926NEG7_9BACI|nr:hypothetical protein [Metabacillus arenae]MBD1378958.1 hypothetical protein [Metabacillus arenae]
MDLKIGDILLVRGDGFISPLIKRFLDSEYSHVAIALENGKICEVDLNVKMKIIDNPYFEYEVFRYKEGLNNEQMQKINAFLRKKCKSSIGYDWWRILSLMIKKYTKLELIIHHPNRYVCSEIVDQAYQYIGIDLVPESMTGDVTPVDLLKSNSFKHVHSVRLLHRSMKGP